MNDTEISLRFRNKVDDVSKLEKYANQLERIYSFTEGLNKGATSSKIAQIGNVADKSSAKAKEGVSSINSDIVKLNQSTLKLTNQFNKAFSVGKIAGFGRAIMGITKSFGNLIKETSDYVENINLLEVAYANGNETIEESSARIEAFIQKMSEAYGLDESNLTRQFGIFKQLANAMELPTETAENLSEHMVKMTNDIASLYNLDINRASNALQSALVGQVRPIRGATGADITEKTLQKTVDQLGLDRTISELSFVEKRLVMVISLTNQLKNAQGDWARTITSVSNQLRIMGEQFKRIGRAIGQFFYKPLSAVLPVINGILMGLYEILNFLSQILGFEMPKFDYSGLSTTADATSDVIDGMDGISDSASDAGKSVDKLKDKLTGLRNFDKLNVINTPTDTKAGGSGGGSGGIGGVDPAIMDAFNKAFKNYNDHLDKVNKKMQEIRDKMLKWLGITRKVDEATGKITYTYAYLNTTIKNIAGTMAMQLAQGLNKVVDKVNFEKFGKNLGKGIQYALTFSNTFVDTFDWFKLSSGIAKGLNKAIEQIDGREVGKFFTNKIKIIVESAYGFVSEFDWKQFGDKIGDAINGAIKNINIPKIAKTATKIVDGIFTALSSAIKKIKWGALFKDLFDGFKELNAVLKIFVGIGIVKAFINIGNGLKKMLNPLSKVLPPIKKLYEYTKVYTGLAGGAGLKGIEKLTTGLKEGTRAWQNNLTAMDKFKGVVTGAGGILVAISLISDAFSNLKDGSFGFKDAITILVGAVVAGFAVMQTAVTAFGAELTLATGGISLLIGAVVALGAGFLTSRDKTKEATDGLQEYRDALDQAHKSAREQTEETIVLYEKNNQLINELSSLVDANGNVVGSTEEVKEKIAMLNKNLGTEYEITNGTITLNGEKVKSLQDLTTNLKKYNEQLKGEALLEGYRDSYVKALKNELEWKRKIADKQADLKKLIGDTDITTQKGWDSLSRGTQNAVKEYLGLTAELANYQDEITDYQKANSLIMQGDYEEASKYLGKTYKNTADNMGYALKDLNEKTNKSKDKIITDLSDLNKKSKFSIKLNLNDDPVKKFKKQYVNKQFKSTLKIDVDTNSINNKKFKVIQTKANGGIFYNGGWHNIASYATGTPIGGAPVGQMFIARERGPELVGSINNHTAVLNNNQIVDSVSDGVYRAVVNANAKGKQSSFNPTFIIQVGSKEVAREVLTDLQETAKSNGKPITIGG